MSSDERAAAAELPKAWEDALAGLTARRHVATRMLFFESAGSTNDIAMRLAERGEGQGLAVIADTQTRGRGRLGRQWFSPPGSGLYVSLVVSPGESPSDPDRATSLVTLMTGVALAEAIQKATGLASSIKWPNDLLIGSRKVAGILAEAVNSSIRLKPDPTYSPDPTNSPDPTYPLVILGYGINVGLASFPPDLADRATSLESELGRAIDRADVGAATFASLEQRYDDLIAGRFDAILDAWRARAIGFSGGRVNWDTLDGVRRGVTEGIDERGALLVRTDRGLERLVAGEVRWDSF